MAEPLIIVAQLETRLGRTLDTTEATQAEAFIDDASALVREIAGDDFVNDDTGVLEVPPALVPVVVQMVRRGINNPLGRSSEDIGDASWQGMGTIHATAREKKTIRRAAGSLGVGAVTLEGYLPLSPEFRMLNDNLLGS